MIQRISLFQAVRCNNNEEQRQAPIYATEKTWLGRGFYFWENEINNAHHWGNKHYRGSYQIYRSSYQNTDEGFDFVDNYEHRECLSTIITKSRARLGRELSLAQIVTSMYKLFPHHKVYYIRMDTGSFFSSEKVELPIQNITPRPWFFAKRLVQVCFPHFPCTEIGLTEYTLCCNSPVIG